jgi:hypothetical protein
MKAKTGSNKGSGIVRYKPIDEDTYPVNIHDPPYFYWRFYCQPNFIVYEKYKNNVKLGYVVLPGEVELFRFESMIAYVEKTKFNEVLCVRE